MEVFERDRLEDLGGDGREESQEGKGRVFLVLKEPSLETER